jgi:Flp pilus assembly pilin Flp
MKKQRNRKSGQTMVEYIIIVVIIAIAALAIFGIFGDTLRHKLGYAVEELGGDESAKDDAVGNYGDSLQIFKDNGNQSQ